MIKVEANGRMVRFADPWGLDGRVTFIEPFVVSLISAPKSVFCACHFDPGRPGFVPNGVRDLYDLLENPKTAN